MDELGLTRYCCRRMVLTHVDLIDRLLQYNRKSLFIALASSVPNEAFFVANERSKDKQAARRAEFGEGA